MKKLFSTIAILSLVLFTSCDKNKEVKQFMTDFAAAVTAKDKATIEKMYPDAAKADALDFSFDAEKAQIEELEGGGWKVVLGEGKEIVIVKNEADGTLSIKESHGVFAFDADAVKFSEALGCYDPKLCDKDNAERLADTLFTKSIMENIEKSLSQNLRVVDKWEGNFAVINDNEFDIAGSLYTVVAKSFFSSDAGLLGGKTYTVEGKDVAQKSSVNMSVPGEWGELDEFKYSIKLNTNAEALLKLYQPTGKEYEEYLKTK